LDLRRFAAHFAMFAWEPYQIRYCPQANKANCTATYPDLQGEKLNTQVIKMRISIAERLRPFSHVPGTSTILPGNGYQVQVFPCLIRLYHLNKGLPYLLTELSLDLKGPIEQFTICNDLEKGYLTVSGKTAEGWMRYRLISAQQHKGVRLLIDRAPLRGFPLKEESKRHLLRDKEWIDILECNIPFTPFQIPSCDRLSLGSHKAQDWELIKRRFNLTEILPLVHRLGQLVPAMSSMPSRAGTLSLLEDCRQSFINERPEKGQERWRHFLLGCFNSMLIPQLEDNNYQGIISNSPLGSLDISPLVLLSEGARLIRGLFVQQKEGTLLILPYLLPSLHSGRLLNVPLEGGGELSLEWTKKTIRRLILYAGYDQELALKFRSGVRHYRVRQHAYAKDKGERKSCSSLLILQKNCHYFFDNFQ
jgi:hypothetical protein